MAYIRILKQLFVVKPNIHRYLSYSKHIFRQKPHINITTLIVLGRVNIARALQNSSYHIHSFMTASFEAKELLICVTDFENGCF